MEQHDPWTPGIAAFRDIRRCQSQSYPIFTPCEFLHEILPIFEAECSARGITDLSITTEALQALREGTLSHMIDVFEHAHRNSLEKPPVTVLSAAHVRHGAKQVNGKLPHEQDAGRSDGNTGPAVNYFDLLDRTAFITIFDKLPQKNLVNPAAVCKHWHAIICGAPFRLHHHRLRFPEIDLSACTDRSVRLEPYRFSGTSFSGRTYLDDFLPWDYFGSRQVTPHTAKYGVCPVCNEPTKESYFYDLEMWQVRAICLGTMPLMPPVSQLRPEILADAQPPPDDLDAPPEMPKGELKMGVIRAPGSISFGPQGMQTHRMFTRYGGNPPQNPGNGDNDSEDSAQPPEEPASRLVWPIFECGKCCFRYDILARLVQHPPLEGSLSPDIHAPLMIHACVYCKTPRLAARTPMADRTELVDRRGRPLAESACCDACLPLVHSCELCNAPIPRGSAHVTEHNCPKCGLRVCPQCLVENGPPFLCVACWKDKAIAEQFGLGYAYRGKWPTGEMRAGVAQLEARESEALATQARQEGEERERWLVDRKRWEEEGEEEEGESVHKNKRARLGSSPLLTICPSSPSDNDHDADTHAQALSIPEMHFRRSPEDFPLPSSMDQNPVYDALDRADQTVYEFPLSDGESESEDWVGDDMSVQDEGQEERWALEERGVFETLKGTTDAASFLPSECFCSTSLFLIGAPVGLCGALRAILEQHGGQLVDSLDVQPTHAIVYESNSGNEELISEALTRSLLVVPQWLLACLRAGRPVGGKLFQPQIYYACKASSPPSEDEPEDDDDEATRTVTTAVCAPDEATPTGDFARFPLDIVRHVLSQADPDTLLWCTPFISRMFAIESRSDVVWRAKILEQWGEKALQRALISYPDAPMCGRYAQLRRNHAFDWERHRHIDFEPYDPLFRMGCDFGHERVICLPASVDPFIARYVATQDPETTRAETLQIGIYDQSTAPLFRALSTPSAARHFAQLTRLDLIPESKCDDETVLNPPCAHSWPQPMLSAYPRLQYLACAWTVTNPGPLVMPLRHDALTTLVLTGPFDELSLGSLLVSRFSSVTRLRLTLNAKEQPAPWMAMPVAVGGIQEEEDKMEKEKKEEEGGEEEEEEGRREGLMTPLFTGAMLECFPALEIFELRFSNNADYSCLRALSTAPILRRVRLFSLACWNNHFFPWVSEQLFSLLRLLRSAEDTALRHSTIDTQEQAREDPTFRLTYSLERLGVRDLSATRDAMKAMNRAANGVGVQLEEMLPYSRWLDD